MVKADLRASTSESVKILIPGAQPQVRARSGPNRQKKLSHLGQLTMKKCCFFCHFGEKGAKLTVLGGRVSMLLARC